MAVLPVAGGPDLAQPSTFRRIASKLPDWGWLLLIASVLRFVNLGAENIWYDESFTSMVANLNGKAFWTAIRGDVHPPLWYMIEWANVRLFGHSELALRLPSALLGVLGVWLLWRLALALGFERRSAFVAGLIAAALPSYLYYSQDARMYPLLVVFVLLAANAAIRGGWLVFTVACIGAVYTQNLGIVYVAAIGLAIFIARIGRGGLKVMRPLIWASGAVGLAWSPWAVWGLAYQAAQVGKGFWMPPLTLGATIYPYIAMTMGTRMADEFQIHVYAASLAALAVGLIASRSWLFTRKGLIVLSVVFGAPLLTVLVSLVWRNVYLHRALLPSTVCLTLLWAYGLTHLSKPNRRIAQAVVVPALAIGLIAHYFPQHGREDINAWLHRYIARNWQAGDVVYHVALDSAILSNYYLASYPYRLMPEASDLSQSLSAETKAAIGFQESRFDDLAAQGFRRAWVVETDTPMLSAVEIREFARIKAKYPYETYGLEVSATSEDAIRLVWLQ
jgi:mannosyltransferase